ncbi:MAG TPA: poly-gamma-glutamate hydrolase family protein [Syntrophomonadaceae bacterium]|nr:poly-gamma-glutamate hydrolase family protein [Syntrophomonadaceae bacterium]HRX21246.1 poly-gamma-glutamate hydrolase family protein [Syntrophomonadaceae bacterium]
MRKKFIGAIILAVLFTPLFWTTSVQADVYSSYSKLAVRQDKGEDYRITSYNGPSTTAVIAIHGGGIEIGTSELAKSVAKLTGSDLYTFEGLKCSNNGILHITSTKFNEPKGKNLVAESKLTLSIHGCSGSSKTTLVGGRDKALAARVKAELKKAGFKTATPKKSLSGTSIYNICNENASNKGVQLELTYAMRQALLKNQDLYDTYVKALVKALK